MVQKEDSISKLLKDSRPEIVDLDNRVKNYSEIKDFLYMKLGDMENIPEYKKHLFLTMPYDKEWFKNYTYHDMIDLMVKLKPIGMKGSYEVLYSNNKYPVGWFGYYHSCGDTSYATSIKVFSFGIDDPTLIELIKKKFDEVVNSYRLVEWSSIKEGPLFNYYINITEKYKGTYEELENKESVIFTISKSISNKDYKAYLRNKTLRCKG